MTWAEFSQKLRDIPMADVLKALGIERSGTRWHCPFHDDQRPSASVYKPKNLLHCFTCNQSWNVIDVAMHCEGLAFLAAAELLAEQFNLERPEKGSYEQRREYREMAEDKRNAEHWACAVEILAELDLERMSAHDMDRSGPTRIVRMARGGGATLTEEYRCWLKANRKLTLAMVEAGRNAMEWREELLERYIESWSENATAA